MCDVSKMVSRAEWKTRQVCAWPNNCQRRGGSIHAARQGSSLPRGNGVVSAGKAGRKEKTPPCWLCGGFAVFEFLPQPLAGPGQRRRQEPGYNARDRELNLRIDKRAYLWVFHLDPSDD